MFSLKTLFIIAGIIYYLYSSFKSNEVQKNKKSTANPTPSQKTTFEEILEKMLDQEQRPSKEIQTPIPAPTPAPIPISNAPKKIVFKDKEIVPKKEKSQGLPFEKRKLNDAREMPSRKQIDRVMLREKKATENTVVRVKDYDVDYLNHDLPHKEHHLSDNSNIKFSFKEEEQEHFEFDARQAIISQIILERKEY